MTWLEDPPPCLLLCFALVIVWTENKNFTISDHWPLYLFDFKSDTISAALAAFVFWGRRLKKVVNFFDEKTASGWPGSRMFWPRNDLAPLLRWRRHCRHTGCNAWYAIQAKTINNNKTSVAAMVNSVQQLFTGANTESADDMMLLWKTQTSPLDGCQSSVRLRLPWPCASVT